jgi:anhydro-N-acetylmuramic acid kinase
MSDLYIGLMSGTSMDGIDATLVRFGDASLEVLETHEHTYPALLRERLAEAIRLSSARSLTDIESLHRNVGLCFRDAAMSLLEKANVDQSSVMAIGSHGQTIRHEPNAPEPYSLQVGDGTVIAADTGITTISDFRTADIELGGQGAPLAPAFHEWLFRRPGTDRVILNIGGIGNVTMLHGDGSDTTGFDTGPGNTLLDAWIGRHRGEAFDQDGGWAAHGQVNDVLLERLLADPYFAAPPPKSTGFEYFNLEWLDTFDIGEHEPADVQATLGALSANSITDAIRGNADEVLVCGGGVHNKELMRRIRDLLPGIDVASTTSAGLDPDWVEAVAFAWLAMRTTLGLPGNLPAVTGASHPAVLGITHRAI